MFLHDNSPIIANLSQEFEFVRLYFVHDLHFGSELFDEKRWERFKNAILSQENSFVCWVGDLMENAIPGSKSDTFTQTMSPFEQKEKVVKEFLDFGDKTLAVVPGNHEHNRTTKTCGLYPLYDCCERAGIGDKYRNIVAFLNVGVGFSKKDKSKQVRYFGQIQHKAKALRSYGTSDFTDGIDFFAYGHDHKPSDEPRAKMVFDKHNNTITKRNVENINCGSGLVWGGYGAQNAYRPQSDKLWELVLFGGEKKLETHGFYP